MSRKKNKLKNKEQNKLQDKYLLFTFYAVFIAVVFIIYGKTKSYDFAIDDKIILVDNIYVIDGISGFTKLIDAAFNNDMSVPGVTRPVAMFSHALDVSLFGMEAGKHHQMNIFYYFILLFLLFYLLRKYFIPNYSVFLSFLIVLLFIAHPVHVESVANIKGRDDILSFIFGTLAFIFFFRNLKENSIINRILIFLSLALAFLSKETGIVFALLLPISYYYFTEVDFKKAFLSTYMYLAFGILLVIIRFSLFTPPPEYINKYNNSILDLESPLQQLAMTLRILWHYLQISLWPQPLIWDYSFGHFDFNKYTNFLAVVSALVYSGLLLWSLLKLKSKNMISFGIIFFLLALSPVSNLFIKIATTFGERLLFIKKIFHPKLLSFSLFLDCFTIYYTSSTCRICGKY
ncbi:MAG: hypothetical protein GQ527_01750 [Bacteroidales bacterium]|nr:hypothetical protein [Bacteroidales bacterium]